MGNNSYKMNITIIIIFYKSYVDDTLLLFRQLLIRYKYAWKCKPYSTTFLILFAFLCANALSCKKIYTKICSDKICIKIIFYNDNSYTRMRIIYYGL